MLLATPSLALTETMYSKLSEKRNQCSAIGGKTVTIHDGLTGISRDKSTTLIIASWTTTIGECDA